MTINGKRSATRIRENGCVPLKPAIDRLDGIRRNPFDHKKTIVVPFDFTPASEHAFDHAISYARNSGSEIWIVHVLERFYGYSFLDNYQKEEWQARAKESAIERLEGLVAS